MLRVATEKWCSLRRRVGADDGVTVPEYMLTLGFISVAVVVAFVVSDVATAINNLTAALTAYITP
jgi:Flp pilus assembly pilin Flp